MTIIGEDQYNTDGNGMILIVEREDHMFAEAAGADGPFLGRSAAESVIAGAQWWASPNEVIEAWYRTFRDSGQLSRPNRRP